MRPKPVSGPAVLWPALRLAFLAGLLGAVLAASPALLAQSQTAPGAADPFGQFAPRGYGFIDISGANADASVTRLESDGTQVAYSYAGPSASQPMVVNTWKDFVTVKARTTVTLDAPPVPIYNDGRAFFRTPVNQLFLIDPLGIAYETSRDRIDIIYTDWSIMG